MLYEGNRGEASKFGFDDTPAGLAAASGPYLPEQWLALLPETRAHFAVAARDEASDLALLDGSVGGAVAAFRQGRGIRPGADAIIIGYPLRGALASGAPAIAGNASALTGSGDDRRPIQITAPVQPGNSGGPVLESSGNAVGVVVSKLDAIAMAPATGDIPQNVNFAASAARAFAVLVECWN